MLRRVLPCLRRFSTALSDFPEHYVYPGNADAGEFRRVLEGTRKPLVQDTTVFKPKEQIEFNRVGELLLYEAEPYRVKEILFPYPHCLPELAVPGLVYLYFANPLGLLWQTNGFLLLASCASFFPHAEYLYSLRYYVSRLWLLRGGSVLKVEHSDISGHRWKSWVFVDEVNLLTEDKKMLEEDKGLNAKVVGADGQLQYETHIQVDNFIDTGRNMQDQVLKLCKEGKVHQPEILEAVLKGFEVDTSNFRINTLHVERWLEPNYNS